jgi:ABC-2 type transport system permease protein
MNSTYVRLELKRMIRNTRFWIFSCSFPIILYFIESGLYGRTKTIPGHSFTYSEYLMCSLAAWGAVNASLQAGARVTEERTSGWQRQLRLTPLKPSSYLIGKLAVGMAVALPATIALSVAGALYGVHLSAAGWLQVALGVWVAALPFALMGVLIGQCAGPANIQTFLSFGLLVLGFLGGLLIPSTGFPTWLDHAVKALPSYWLAEVGHGVFAGNGDIVRAVLIIAGWSVALAIAVTLRYRRDSARS